MQVCQVCHVMYAVRGAEVLGTCKTEADQQRQAECHRERRRHTHAQSLQANERTHFHTHTHRCTIISKLFCRVRVCFGQTEAVSAIDRTHSSEIQYGLERASCPSPLQRNRVRPHIVQARSNGMALDQIQLKPASAQLSYSSY